MATTVRPPAQTPHGGPTRRRDPTPPSNCPSSHRPLHRDWQPFINLGLPRTGTTSFTIASSLIGMRASSTCSLPNNYWHVRDFAGPCLYNGSMVGGSCGTQKLQVTADFNASNSTFRTLLGRGSRYQSGAATFDSHSDAPWFMLDATALRAAYPRASFVCTYRDAESWVHSVITFQRKTTFPPGSLLFLYHVKSKLGYPASRPGRGTHGRPNVPEPAALRAYHAWHHNHTCAGLPLLRVEDDAATKWRVLCDAAPAKYAARCRTALATEAWPVTQSIGAIRAYEPIATKPPRTDSPGGSVPSAAGMRSIKHGHASGGKVKPKDGHAPGGKVKPKDGHASGGNVKPKGALILSGLAYHATLRSQVAVDFRFSSSNYATHLIDGLLDQGSGVDVFLCAADSPATPALLKTYAPTRYALLEHVDNITAHGGAKSVDKRVAGAAMLVRNRRLITALKLCLDHASERGITYGLVVVTRFDAFFTAPMRFANINHAAFNVATHLKPFNAVDDTFYALPFSLLRRFHDLMAARVSTSAHADGAHILKGAIQREVSPIHFILDQGRDKVLYQHPLLTLVRCSRPHAIQSQCRPADVQVDWSRGPHGAYQWVMAPWHTAMAHKRIRLASLLEAERTRCAQQRAFGLLDPRDAPGSGRLHEGVRVLVVGVRTRSMRQFNGSIGVVRGGTHNRSGLVPVQLVSPPVLDEDAENRPITWMMHRHNLLEGVGATPEEVHWCTLNQKLPVLPPVASSGGDALGTYTVGRAPFGGERNA